MVALLLPERVGDPPHPAGGIDQQHVEAHAGAAPIGMLGEHDLGGGEQPGPLAHPQRRSSGREDRAAPSPR